MNGFGSSRKFARIQNFSLAPWARDLQLTHAIPVTLRNIQGEATMARQSKSALPPSREDAQWTVPLVLPDVATQPHPLGHAPEPSSAENAPEAGDTQLQDVLPEIKKLAQKVGGLKKLARLVETLDEMDK
jgi:hypothetical protein